MRKAFCLAVLYLRTYINPHTETETWIVSIGGEAGRCSCGMYVSATAHEQQLWRKGCFIWAWPFCAHVCVCVYVCVDGSEKKGELQKASVVEMVQSAEEKSEWETPCVCGRSPAIWTVSSLPPCSPPLLLFLSSPLLTGVLFMEDPFHLSVCYARSPQYMLMR